MLFAQCDVTHDGLSDKANQVAARKDRRGVNNQQKQDSVALFAKRAQASPRNTRQWGSLDPARREHHGNDVHELIYYECERSVGNRLRSAKLNLTKIDEEVDQR